MRSPIFWGAMSSFGVMDRVVCHAVIAVPFLILLTKQGTGLSSNARWSMVGAIVSILAVKDFQKAQPNFYDVLHVPVRSDKQTVFNAYDRMQKNYKLDPEIYTKTQMDQAKRAHSVLTNVPRKKMYVRFGDIGVDLTENDFIYICGYAIVSSLICYCIAHLMTAFEHTSSARIWICVYLVGSTCCELYARFADPKMLSILPFVGRRLVHEQMMWLRGMFPTVLAICVATAGETFSNMKGHNHGMLTEIVKTNGDIIAAIREFCTAPVFDAVTQVSGKQTEKFDDINIPRPQHPDFDISFEKDKKATPFFGRRKI